MPDPYLPALAAFALPLDEQAVVTSALASSKPWDYVPDSEGEVAALKSAKDRILRYHLQRHGWTCCYCRTNLHAAGPFMTDREHVLPKGNATYTPYSYAIWNLAAACKRCNLQFKGRGDAFVVDSADSSKFQSSDNYRLVHPNFDLWEDHLVRLAVQINAKNIVMIFRRSGDKAAYTHDFFRLHAFEVDSFDDGQGLEIAPEMSAAAAELRKLADRFRQ